MRERWGKREIARERERVAPRPHLHPHPRPQVESERVRKRERERLPDREREKEESRTAPRGGLQTSFQKSHCPEKIDFQAQFGHVPHG